MQAITIVMPVNLGSESLYSKRQDGKRGGGKKGWTFHPCFLLALKDPGRDKATNKKCLGVQNRAVVRSSYLGLSHVQAGRRELLQCGECQKGGSMLPNK